MISISCSFAYTRVSLTSHKADAGSTCAMRFFYLRSKSRGRTSKSRPFIPATLAGELTAILLLIRSRGIRGAGSVQLDEEPDRSSPWMDRRVDKQIATREGNEKRRVLRGRERYIYTYMPVYIYECILRSTRISLFYSDASCVLKNQRVLFSFRGQIRSVTPDLPEQICQSGLIESSAARLSILVHVYILIRVYVPTLDRVSRSMLEKLCLSIRK